MRKWSRLFGRLDVFKILSVMALAGCGDGGGPLAVDELDLTCSIPESDIFSGGPGKDGIPSLDDPWLVGPSDEDARYVLDEDRVIGVASGGEAIAIPLSIMWWHEIVNIVIDGHAVAVTHCPLTGSSLAFDRGEIGGATFGVSGLLYQNNLIMYDRNSDESYWPQMMRGARCGPRDGAALAMFPLLETTWGRWRALHPNSRIVSSDTGYDRDYTTATGYPYGDYEDIDNTRLLFPVEIDRRRPPKERIFGIPGVEGGVAFPFGELDQLGSQGVLHADGSDGSVPEGTVLFWEKNTQTAALLDPTVNGSVLTFEVVDFRIRDVQTGSGWRVNGEASDGPLAGTRLAPVADGYVAFWFAWAAFEPTTTIWTAQ